MWSNWTAQLTEASEKASASLSQALEKSADVLEKTGDAITKAATTHKHHHASEETSEGGGSGATTSSNAAAAAEATQAEGPETAAASAAAEKQKQLLQNLSVGWSTVVESTKSHLKQAQHTFQEETQRASQVLKEEQQKMQRSLKKARSQFYKRSLDLPLDVEALKDAEVVYLTSRIITMSHPALPSQQHPDIISGERKLAAVQHLLQKRHNGKFMVWNLSEIPLDEDVLDQQVLTFSFPGSPSPPLGLLLKLLMSLESWLRADPSNVAVVHCLTGKGRTSTVLAAFLCWMNEAQFTTNIYEALEYIAMCKQLTVEELTIPSQRRYAGYFKNMLDSVRPSQPPLRLKRVILSEAPRYAKGPPLAEDKKTGSEEYDDTVMRMGCAPYLQIFKAGQLLHTSPASLEYNDPSAAGGAESSESKNSELPFCQVADGAINFHVDQVLQGDILIRCRHLSSKRQRVSMFRAAFHTGYVPPKVWRLTKSQLDGACHDDRFEEDFFVDLIFEEVTAETAASQLQQEEQDVSERSDSKQEGTGADERETNTYRASVYDAMLHRDSRFWDVIKERREQHAEAAHEREIVTSKEDSNADPNHPHKSDPNFGPTVGRRREFVGAKRKTSKKGKGEVGGEDSEKKQPAELQTFSIGGEYDFLPETIESEHASNAQQAAVQQASKPKQQVAKPKKRDTLMEALMGVLDDDTEENQEDNTETEEIVFGDDSMTADDSERQAGEPQPTIVQLPPKKGEVSGDAAAAKKEEEEPSTEQETEETGGSEKDTKKPALASADVGDDMDELLAGTVEELGPGGDDVDTLSEIDDADLEDLENFLGASSK